MSRHALICERCGRLYSHSNITDIGSDGKEHYITGAAIVMSGRYVHKKKELCPTCLKHFLAWYQGEEALKDESEKDDTNA